MKDVLLYTLFGALAGLGGFTIGWIVGMLYVKVIK